MLVFGSLEYYIENEEDDTGFTSIPQVRFYSVFYTLNDNLNTKKYGNMKGLSYSCLSFYKYNNFSIVVSLYKCYRNNEEIELINHFYS